MACILSIEPKPGYLHAIVTGENTAENVRYYMGEVLRECDRRDCHRVLIEERLEGPRLGTSEVFELVVRGSGEAPGKMKAIAFVDVHAEGDLMRFAETVGANRGLPLRVFDSVGDAERWLSDEGRSTAG